MSQAPPQFRQSKVTERFEHIELTEAEKQEAIQEGLFRARKEKARLIRINEYWERVNAEKTIPVYRPAQLGRLVMDRFKVEKNVDFVLDEDCKEIFELLCMYFTDDRNFELMPVAIGMPALSLKKGIALFGPIGTGKTTMMRMFRTNQHASYSVHSCRNVTELHKNYGAEEIGRFNHNWKPAANQEYGQHEAGFCFDDLGTEEIPSVHYSDRRNVMAEAILNRYDRELDYRFTHITTNLTTDQIKDSYGDRCANRMKQMFNIITFPVTAKSRR